MANAILPMPPYKWQTKLWDDFIKRNENSSVPHAFLICGQEGFGAEALATAMGQYMLCLSPSEKLVCGKCKACHLLDAGTHPDLMVVTAEEKGKQIKVDQIREISGFVGKTAQQGGYKIIILYPAEDMNTNSANALLKNLEEPAGKTVFILVTKQLSRLLPTIRSRCALINLPVPDAAQALSWLSDVGFDDAAEAQELLSEAGGAPLLVKDWKDSAILEERAELIKGLIDIVDGKTEPMIFAKKWGNQDPLFILGVMLLGIDATLAFQVADKPVGKVYEALVGRMKMASTKVLYAMRDKLCAKKAQLLGPSNLNPAMVVEELTLDWIAAAKPLK
ncbi:DNA polymerase III subunit delta' [Thalassocella blandensis]|nr:DNA polymerase III subunit delta' [Thalassocella blandensis]